MSVAERVIVVALVALITLIALWMGIRGFRRGGYGPPLRRSALTLVFADARFVAILGVIATISLLFAIGFVERRWRARAWSAILAMAVVAAGIGAGALWRRLRRARSRAGATPRRARAGGARP